MFADMGSAMMSTTTLAVLQSKSDSKSGNSRNIKIDSLLCSYPARSDHSRPHLVQKSLAEMLSQGSWLHRGQTLARRITALALQGL